MNFVKTWFLMFYDWLNTLDGALAAVVGGVTLTALTGFFKYIFVPASRWILSKLGKVLYPLASGAVVLDRYFALPRYLKNIDQTVGRLRNPWLAEGQKLKDIFVPISTTAKGAAGERTELKRVFASTRFAVVIGAPGSGKTTALKSIAVDCIRGQRYVPVFIELRQMMHGQMTLEDFVVKTFIDNDFPKPRRLIGRLRSAGRLVFLLDGLDEVDDVDKRKQIIDAIRKLITDERRSSAPCHVYLSSRPTGYQGQLSDITTSCCIWPTSHLRR